MSPQEPDTQSSQKVEAITLTNLRPAVGSTKAKLRVGRGRASGAGKTSNRGHNGEGQRSGRSRKRGFEGGQMPGYRRAPKLGSFYQPNKKEYLILNLRDLDRVIGDDQSELTLTLLVEKRLLRNGHAGVRILGEGAVTRALTLYVHHVSSAAKEKIEAAGGTIHLLSQEG